MAVAAATETRSKPDVFIEISDYLSACLDAPLQSLHSEMELNCVHEVNFEDHVKYYRGSTKHIRGEYCGIDDIFRDLKKACTENTAVLAGLVLKITMVMLDELKDVEGWGEEKKEAMRKVIVVHKKAMQLA